MINRRRDMFQALSMQLMYHLENYVCNGRSSTAIDTGLMPYNTSSYPYGFKVEFVGKVTTIPSGEYPTWLTCMDESGYPWPGFVLRQDNGKTDIIANPDNGASATVSVENTKVGDTITCTVIYNGDTTEITLNGKTNMSFGSVNHNVHLMIGCALNGSGSKMRYGYVNIIELNIYRFNKKTHSDDREYLPSYTLKSNEYIPLGILNTTHSTSSDGAKGQILIYFGTYNIRTINKGAVITEDNTGRIYSCDSSGYLTINGTRYSDVRTSTSVDESFISMLQLTSAGDEHNDAIWWYDRVNGIVTKYRWFSQSQPYNFESYSYTIGGRSGNSAQMPIHSIGIKDGTSLSITSYYPFIIDGEVWFCETFETETSKRFKVYKT